MNDDKTEITLITSNRAGVLSSIMMSSVKVGLMVSRNRSIKIDENTSRVSIVFNGKLSCSQNELRGILESLPEVHSIENVYLNDIKASTNTSITKKQNAHLTQLRSIDIITPESLQIAEAYLVDLLGPVASMLIKSASTEVKHIGDLYLLLSNELEGEGEEKENFLGLVDGLK